VYNHYKELIIQEYEGIEIEKSNILLIGPTVQVKPAGPDSGPFSESTVCHCDATVLTEAGYVGEDVENVLVRLYQAADYQVERRNGYYLPG